MSQEQLIMIIGILLDKITRCETDIYIKDYEIQNLKKEVEQYKKKEGTSND